MKNQNLLISFLLVSALGACASDGSFVDEADSYADGTQCLEFTRTSSGYFDIDDIDAWAKRQMLEFPNDITYPGASLARELPEDIDTSMESFSMFLLENSSIISKKPDEAGCQVTNFSVPLYFSSKNGYVDSLFGTQCHDEKGIVVSSRLEGNRTTIQDGKSYFVKYYWEDLDGPDGIADGVIDQAGFEDFDHYGQMIVRDVNLDGTFDTLVDYEQWSAKNGIEIIGKSETTTYKEPFKFDVVVKTMSVESIDGSYEHFLNGTVDEGWKPSCKD